MLTMPVTMVSTLMETLPSCQEAAGEELLFCVSSSQESWRRTPTLTNPLQPQLSLVKLTTPEAEEDTEMVLAGGEAATPTHTMMEDTPATLRGEDKK